MARGFVSLGMAVLLGAAQSAAGAEQELRIGGRQHVELRTFIGSVVVGEAPGSEYIVRVRTARPGIAAELRDGGGRVVVVWPKDIAMIHAPTVPALEGWFVKAKSTYDGHRYQLQRGPADYTAEVTVLVPRGQRLVVKQQLGPVTATAVRAGMRLESDSGRVVVERSRGGLVIETGASDITVRNHDGEVKADTGAGDVAFEDNAGRQVADTGSGNVIVRRGSGELVADSGSGDVLVAGFTGDVRADTGSGDIRLTDLRGVRRVDADTGSGDVVLQGDLGGIESLDIDTGSGSALVESTTAASLQLAVDTGSGRVTTAGAARLERVGNDEVVVIGDGVHRGSIDTGSGDIRVTVAGGP